MSKWHHDHVTGWRGWQYWYKECISCKTNLIRHHRQPCGHWVQSSDGLTPSVCVAATTSWCSSCNFIDLSNVLRSIKSFSCLLSINWYVCVCNHHTCFYQRFLWQNKDSSAFSFERAVSVSVANVCPVDVTTCHGVEGLGLEKMIFTLYTYPMTFIIYRWYWYGLYPWRY